MEVESDKLIGAASISFLAVFLSTSFQVGYFREIGIEFISYLNAFDIIVPAAFASPPILFFYWLAEILTKRIDKEIAQGGRWSSILIFHDKIEIFLEFIFRNIFIYAIFVIFVAAIAIFIIFIGVADLAFNLIFLPFICIISMWNFGIIRSRISQFGSVSGGILAAFLLTSGCAAIVFGDFYASYFAGKKCEVRLVDGRMRVNFLRAVSSGLLVTFFGNTVFFASSEVKSISCRYSNYPNSFSA